MDPPLCKSVEFACTSDFLTLLPSLTMLGIMTGFASEVVEDKNDSHTCLPLMVKSVAAHYLQ